ncbi:OLC1v1002365C1 [Oldenlandia corymbosa var. corymbosa]|uniref:OLC1v1002365C1 n=1 Tax=Oldenlandia corymbosa var. corymbosa TaxID=529605 RepID=A0AAV1D7G4_OLDCO|nr:OLC1v1002365C1 [Oldenlandia corymbosa var. corymbosa]
MKRTPYYNALSIVPPVQDQWPIKKALTLSDVDITHPFLTLSRQQVDSHIVVHMSQQQQDHLRAVGQVDFNARDDDTGEMYVMKLKWRGSYYNLIGKWGKVVRGKRLNVGQDIYIRWSNGCLHFSVPQQQVVTMPPLRMLALPAPPAQDQWPIKKVLTLSDVDLNHPFLPLPRRLVEDHILLNWTQEQRELLRREEQVNVNARDYDTGEIYLMKLKWRGNYYNLIGKWGTIIRQKGLGVGKEINLRWMNECLYFSVPQERYIATASGQDNWPIKKALTSSDVDINHPFLTLPGKAVEDHILFYWTPQAREQLRNEHQINVNARDEDTGDLYLMKLRWRGSYYNLIGKWGKIVRGKKLHVGREIRLRWENGCLLFSVP